MHQRDLNRSVARSTGETVAEISRRGFSIADPQFLDFDPEPELDHYFDWDSELALSRNTSFVDQPKSSLLGYV